MIRVMNEQERFWSGQFGNDYSQRNVGRVASNIEFFRRALKGVDIRSIIEFGANIGENLQALRQLYPKAFLTGLEINEEAAKQLGNVADQVCYGSMLEFAVAETWQLAFTKGVLIHIAPDNLPKAYEVIYQSSDQYILIAEYYNPTPTVIPYRGHLDRLWKRDFAGEMLDKYKDLRLIDYGFVYHRDQYPQDDLHWFLMEK